MKKQPLYLQIIQQKGFHHEEMVCFIRQNASREKTVPAPV